MIRYNCDMNEGSLLGIYVDLVDRGIANLDALNLHIEVYPVFVVNLFTTIR